MSQRPSDHCERTGEGPPASPAAAPGPADARSPRVFRHEMANTLHAILLQVRCTHAAMDKNDDAGARAHLAQIESAVDQSRQLLEAFVSAEGSR